LIAMLIRCRKADILGKKDSYIRKVHAGYRGAVISQEERKYEPQFFGLYRSHTQGNSVVEAAASDVTPLYVKLKRVTRIVWAVALVACVGAVMYACRDKGPKAGQIGVVSTTTTSIGPPPGVTRPAWLDDLPPAPARASSSAKSSATADEKIDLEPLKDKLVHITGWLKSSKGAVYTFTVSGQGIRQFDVLGADLVAAGYVWKPLGECIGYLMWEGKTRAVTCDAPAIQNGGGNAPVVIDAKSGSRSDDGIRNAPPEERPLIAMRPKA
jgi:zona occludens toxin